ncbi:hypothetical protein BGW36DRAFT_418366 [Talaromyces proteolyticus]|uniref:histidine kinase n=1 Tax=Talaromyces proteolyticus TaxID=1131652 RepID=A0AAD4PXR4_9EURO|nr:uncharacterized protein BGW36DRAFT_418366 [Talaromyces proteolyticus]KAH8693609.1 hypothetical protein BGW36DRAFT_418366 [Talaromyces proteolyticus]
MTTQIDTNGSEPSRISFWVASREPGEPEDTAAERLVALKRALRATDTEITWEKLLEELALLGHAQCAFVVRKVYKEGDDSEGDLTMACYYDDRNGKRGWLRDHTYRTTGTPCEQMKHGKVYLVPSNLQSYAVSNDLPFTAEAYMATPLWSGDHNIGHFGMVWSSEGLCEKTMSWPYIELLLHSLEDILAQRVLDENTLSSKVDNSLSEISLPTPTYTKPQVATAPSSPVFAHPLKPFAPSLSHELRTPMQGVVGMLDVMYANVEEAIGRKAMRSKSSSLLQDLKESIELVQDSARRAVEAADNVVHAYDLNMEVPETPHMEVYASIMGDILPPASVASTDCLPFKEDGLPENPYKRRRSFSVDWTSQGRAAKRSSRRNGSQGDLSPRSEVKYAIQESDKIVYSPTKGRIEEVVVNAVSQRPSMTARRMLPHMLLEGVPSTAVRHTKIRELLHLVINESLHIGKRPESTISEKTLLGEHIDVHALAPNGETCVKSIDWSVDASVPETVFVDERDLAKLISCVFLNAVKFTERGKIRVSATLSNKSPQHIRINIRDTGTGIPEEFFPSLFKPFSREDDSTTRTRDGLGLGLLVAKGLSRKMGGDLLCVDSSTSGPERGSEFEIRIPVNPSGSLSRPGTPHNESLTDQPPEYNSPPRSSADEAGVLNEPRQIEVTLPASSIKPAIPHSLPTALVNSDSKQTPIRSLQPPVNLQSSGLAQAQPLTFLVAEDNQINRKILVNMLRKLGYRDVYEAYDGREAVRIMQEILLSSYPLPSPVSSPSLPSSDSGMSNPLSPDTVNGKKRTKPIDVVLMDLWMPEMDGYEATSKIFEMVNEHCNRLSPHVQRDDSPAESRRSSWDQDSEQYSPSAGDISPKVLAVSADATDEALNKASSVGIQGYMTKPYKLADLERLIADCCTFNVTSTTLLSALLFTGASTSVLAQQQQHQHQQPLFKTSDSRENNEHTEVGDFIIQYLQARDFTVEKQIIEPEAEKGRFNIYAYPNSSPTPPRVLLSSHIDTVPPYIPYSLHAPSTTPRSSPSWREEIVIAGRGSVDAKGSVAAQVFAVLEYLQTHPDASIGLLFVVGEEVNGVGMQWFSQSALNTSPPTFHTVIFGEPTELALVSGHKGSLFFTLSAKGKAAHSGYPWLGRSAVSALLPALLKLDTLGDIPVDEGGLPGSEKFGKSTINIGRLEAGIAGNVVPVHAEASVNIRLAYHDVEKAKEILTNAVRDATHGDENVTIEWGNNGVGHAPIDIDADVEGFNVTTVNYATDVWYLKLHEGSGGSPIGRVRRYLYGPGSIFVAHGANEAIKVGDLEAAVAGYKKLIDAAIERNS